MCPKVSALLCHQNFANKTNLLKRNSSRLTLPAALTYSGPDDSSHPFHTDRAMEWTTSTTSKSRSTSSTPATSNFTPTEPKLNLYSKKFIPLRQREVNSVGAYHTFLSPSPPYVDFEEYAQTFLPRALLSAAPSTQLLIIIRSPRYALDVQPWGPQIPLGRLDIRSYVAHFMNGLIEERRALAEEFKQYDLFATHLEPGITWQKDDYKLSVPGLREYIPAVYVGDTVLIRAIRRPTIPGCRPFDGIEYAAYIWAIDRLKVSRRFSS